MNHPPPQQKKGMSTLTIVLIVLGVMFVLGAGTCTVLGIFAAKMGKELVENAGDGGLVLASPPAVKAELAGSKKDYVGEWQSVSGKSTLSITPEGELHLVKAETGGKEEYTASIASFKGNDIEIKVVVTLTVPVTSPPKVVGDHWEMTAKGITFQRPH